MFKLGDKVKCFVDIEENVWTRNRIGHIVAISNRRGSYKYGVSFHDVCYWVTEYEIKKVRK